MAFTAIVPFALTAWLAVDARLPESPRLDPVRQQLEQALREADQQKLPTALLVSKVREGEAKRVDPHLVLSAVKTLSSHLIEAKRLATGPHAPAPSPRLVQAIAEGRMAGLDEAQIRALLVAQTEAQSIAAIDTLADLHLRGYNGGHVLPLVKQVLNKDPGALPQLAASLEVVRRDYALTSTETAQVMDQGFRERPSVRQATAHVRSELGAQAAAKGQSKVKENGMEGRGVQANPGRGRGPDKMPNDKPR
jgi:hypothetical protein